MLLQSNDDDNLGTQPISTIALWLALSKGRRRGALPLS